MRIHYSTCGVARIPFGLTTQHVESFDYHALSQIDILPQLIILWIHETTSGVVDDSTSSIYKILET